MRLWLNISARGTVVVAVSPAPRDSPLDEECAPADEPALRQLYTEYGPALVSYLMRITRGDRDLAEDVVQETMIRAWRHPEAQRADGRWSRPWLFTVAQRIAIDHIRARNARPVALYGVHIDTQARTEDDLERSLDAREVRAAVVALPERLRTILVETYFRERSIAEVAEVLGIPPGTVKSRTFHALRALRRNLVRRGFLTRPPSGR